MPQARLVRAFEQLGLIAAIAMAAACTEGSTGGRADDAGQRSDVPSEGEGPRDDATVLRDSLSEEGAVSEPISLFNGRDFTGWEKYLGPPNGSTEPQGSADPNGVFSVVVTDGAPAIHISGEVWGALTSLSEFENYHLRMEFKWGSHPVWPPLTARDSGLLYHSVGPFGAVKQGGGMLADPPGSGWFMTSMELQIAENDLGSYYSLGPIIVNEGVYSVTATAQFENPVGTWNVVDVYVFGNESVQVVNGHPVAHVRGAAVVDNDDIRPLTRGKIQLQSESMEIFMRAITLTFIDRIPPELL